MIDREVTSAGDGPIERRPLLAWDGTRWTYAGKALRAVLNPYGRGLQEGVDIGAVLAENPRQGETLLDDLVSQTRAEISRNGDGMIYLLVGARGLHTSPMEYGGHFLERDREILAEVRGAIVFVVGEEDAYLDFVSDLPADIFAWDAIATGVSVPRMRSMRPGLLASNDPDADIELQLPEGAIADFERQIQDHAARL